MRIVKLLSIELKNWRQFKSFSQKFYHGITCIVGPNGVGKSSLLDAIMFSLTESWGDNYSKKSSNIRFGAKGDAYVKAKWQINDVCVEIEKNLRKNKSKLLLPTGRVVTAAAEISNELERLFGATRGLLETAVFIAQGQVDNFLHLTKSNWLGYVGQFCDLEHVEKIRELLQHQLTTDSQLVRSDIRSGIKQLKLQLKERQSRLNETKRLLRKYRARLVDNADVKIAELQQCRDALVVVANYKQLNVDVNKAKAQYLLVKQKHAKSVLELKAELAQLETRKQVFDQKSKSWHRLVNAADERLKLRKRLKKSKSDLAKLKLSADKLEKKVLEAKQAADKVSAEYTTLVRLRHRLSDKEKALASRLKLLEQGVCPTCGSSVKSSYIDQTQTELNNVSREINTALNAEKDTLRNHTSLQNELQNLASQYDDAKLAVSLCAQEVKQSKLAIKNLPKTSKTKIKAIRSELIAATMFHATHKDVARRLEHARTTIKQAKSVYSTLVRQLAKSKILVNKYGTNTKALTAKIASLDAMLKTHRDAEASLKANAKVFADYKYDVAELTNRLAKNKKLANSQQQLVTWLKDLSEWREVLHKDKLQKVIVENYLAMQLVKINSWLQRFKCSFSVQLADDLTLAAKKANGDVHTVRQLSGGQKTMLAIAFRLAANDQSLLVLDEPTAGVDSEKLDKFAEFLSELSSQLKREGRQLLLVTHDDRLLGQSFAQRKAVFDNVIRLQ
jgi:DNA repair exonuclease SbcCD ATPase subunit